MDRLPVTSWRGLLRGHWPQWATAAVLLLLWVRIDAIPPARRSLYVATDQQYWHHSYPHIKETVPDYWVPLLTVAPPLLVFIAAAALGRMSRYEAHHMVLALLACITATGIVTNLLKVGVGRPRPDFVHRCWPHSPKPVVSAAGMPVCDAGTSPGAIIRGMRSFPSGHSSWSGAGLGFLSLWLIESLHCFSGAARPASIVASLLPLGVAGAIGVQRLQFNKHHAEDVLAGLLLGWVLAFIFYRQARASVQAHPIQVQAREPAPVGYEEQGGSSPEWASPSSLTPLSSLQQDLTPV